MIHTARPRRGRACQAISLLAGALVSLVSPLGAAEPHSAAAAAPAAIPRLGINLAGPADWNTELPFVDVFRLSRRWTSQREGAPWGRGPELDLDRHGWVRRLEAGCWAESPICTIDGGHYPSGRYTILYSGQGTLDVWNARVAARAPGRIEFDADPARGGFHLKLTATDPADPVRDIRVVMPGFLDTYRADPWHPAFLDRWRGVACLRFMDFMETNGSRIKSWADRPVPEDATYSEKGVALELMLDLANRLRAAPWFCMPHLADDDYVRQFARMVRERLDSRLAVYVEYSNEVWNGQFAQHHYAGEQGIKLGFAEKPWEAAWRYTARRSVEIFRIWEEVFGGRARLVRVLASQAANPYVAEQILPWEDAYRHADALGIAPYISCNVHPEGERLSAATVRGWTVDQALDYMERTALPEAIDWIAGNKAVADRYGLKLVAYEAGQHMVGVGGAENDEALTRLLHAANAHPRMGEIYRSYYAAWERAGGDLLCHFSSVGRWSKWGSWGLLQHADDDPRTSPKFVATMEWAAEQNRPDPTPTR